MSVSQGYEQLVWFQVSGASRFTNEDFGFQVYSFEFWVSGSGFVPPGDAPLDDREAEAVSADFRFRVSNFGFRVSGFGFQGQNLPPGDAPPADRVAEAVIASTSCPPADATWFRTHLAH